MGRAKGGGWVDRSSNRLISDTPDSRGTLKLKVIIAFDPSDPAADCLSNKHGSNFQTGVSFHRQLRVTGTGRTDGRRKFTSSTYANFYVNNGIEAFFQICATLKLKILVSLKRKCNAWRRASVYFLNETDRVTRREKQPFNSHFSQCDVWGRTGQNFPFCSPFLRKVLIPLSHVTAKGFKHVTVCL